MMITVLLQVCGSLIGSTATLSAVTYTLLKMKASKAWKWGLIASITTFTATAIPFGLFFAWYLANLNTLSLDQMTETAVQSSWGYLFSVFCLNSPILFAFSIGFFVFAVMRFARRNNV